MGKQAYAKVIYAWAADGGLPDSAHLMTVLDSVAPSRDADEGAYTAWQANADRTLLLNAINRAVEVKKYRLYVEGLSSGASDGTTPATPAKFPDSSIAGESINYQLAVLVTQQLFNTAARGVAGQAAGLVLNGTIPWVPAGTLGNQYEFVGTEIDGTSSTDFTSGSNWHYGLRQETFIEDQPLSRGNVVLSDVWQTVNALGVRLLAPGYSLNDWGDTHSLVLVMDSLAVQNVFAKLAPKVDLATINAIFKQASNLKAGSLLSQGTAEGDVLENGTGL